MPLPFALLSACIFAGLAFTIGRWQRLADRDSMEGEAELRSRILSASRKRGGGFDVTYDPDLYGADNARISSNEGAKIPYPTEAQSQDTMVATARSISAADIRTLGNAPMIEYTVALAQRMQSKQGVDMECVTSKPSEVNDGKLMAQNDDGKYNDDKDDSDSDSDLSI